MAGAEEDEIIQPPQQTLAEKAAGFLWASLLVRGEKESALFHGLEDKENDLGSKASCEYGSNGMISSGH